MTSVNYVKASVKNIEDSAKRRFNRTLPMKATTPMQANYSPELNGTPELNDDETQFFQELIGVLRWATEIGRVDILHETSILSQYLGCPRQGHLDQALHIVSYLKKKLKLTLYFDTQLPQVEVISSTKRDAFKEIYRDAEESRPHRMPVPRGRAVTTMAFVDASHAANKVTRRSHTGFIIFVNRAPITWFSKRQSTVESSTFSSEFIAMRACVEAIEHLRFKN